MSTQTFRAGAPGAGIARRRSASRRRARRRRPRTGRALAARRQTSSAERLQAARAERNRLPLDVALVPEREREQPPQLPREVLAPGDVVVEQARHDTGIEVALAAQGVRGKRLAGERLERAP